MTTKPGIKALSVRFPVPLWIKLRRLQDHGKVKNINSAVNTGLELLVWIIESGNLEVIENAMKEWHGEGTNTLN